MKDITVNPLFYSVKFDDTGITYVGNNEHKLSISRLPDVYINDVILVALYKALSNYIAEYEIDEFI